MLALQNMTRAVVEPLVVVRVRGPMCAGLSSLPKSHAEWLIRKYGAFEIDRVKKPDKSLRNVDPPEPREYTSC